MIPLDDPRWKQLHRPCFPGVCDIADRLRDLEAATDLFALTRAWDELHPAVHHQGDVSVGSYAAVPHMVRICDTDRTKLDWNLFAWVGLIEECRLTVRRNPSLPTEFAASYFGAMNRMHQLVFDLSGEPWGRYLAQCITTWQLLVKGHVEAAVEVENLPWRPNGERT
jgi:hypothetical protein